MWTISKIWMEVEPFDWIGKINKKILFFKHVEIEWLKIGFFAWSYKHMCKQRTVTHAATYNPVVQFLSTGWLKKPTWILLPNKMGNYSVNFEAIWLKFNICIKLCYFSGAKEEGCRRQGGSLNNNQNFHLWYLVKVKKF